MTQATSPEDLLHAGRIAHALKALDDIAYNSDYVERDTDTPVVFDPVTPTGGAAQLTASVRLIDTRPQLAAGVPRPTIDCVYIVDFQAGAITPFNAEVRTAASVQATGQPAGMGRWHGNDHYLIIDDWCEQLGKEGYVVMYGNPVSCTGTEQAQLPLLRDAMDFCSARIKGDEQVFRVQLARRHGLHRIRELTPPPAREAEHEIEPERARQRA